MAAVNDGMSEHDFLVDLSGLSADSRWMNWVHGKPLEGDAAEAALARVDRAAGSIDMRVG